MIFRILTALKTHIGYFISNFKCLIKYFYELTREDFWIHMLGFKMYQRAPASQNPIQSIVSLVNIFPIMSKNKIEDDIGSL